MSGFVLLKDPAEFQGYLNQSCLRCGLHREIKTLQHRNEKFPKCGAMRDWDCCAELNGFGDVARWKKHKNYGCLT